ncbi:MAG: aldo/keto reductase [Erysipelotrichaceae bacterium]|nr:aldo/keto reductase [Erysipelotrichaceae bacterium]
MEYREMKNTGIKPSLLGFGCMRFPLLENGKIDRSKAEEMMDTAIRAGVTYIDTAYPYHEQESELFVGEVLKKYKRDSYLLATKCSLWYIETPEDTIKMFENQLNRLQVQYFDFYLIHSLSKELWDKALKLGVLDYLLEMKKQGRIRQLGFSFHDEFEVFEEIIRYTDWDFCQIQLNYIDTEIQAGMKGYHLAEELGIPLVVMEPIKGGTLAKLSDDMEAKFKNVNPQRSLSSWALRWVASLDNVKVILSGMTTMEHVEDNLNTFNNFKMLSWDEQNTVKEVADMIHDRKKNGCTGCNYCMPCPYGVNIPRNFRIWNDLGVFGDEKKAKARYFTHCPPEQRSDMCQWCGACEPMCPQNIPIREDLKKMTEEFGKL